MNSSAFLLSSPSAFARSAPAIGFSALGSVNATNFTLRSSAVLSVLLRSSYAFFSSSSDGCCALRNSARSKRMTEHSILPWRISKSERSSPGDAASVVPSNAFTRLSRMSLPTTSSSVSCIRPRGLSTFCTNWLYLNESYAPLVWKAGSALIAPSISASVGWMPSRSVSWRSTTLFQTKLLIASSWFVAGWQSVIQKSKSRYWQSSYLRPSRMYCVSEKLRP